MERILVFQHVKHENPGRFLEFFKNEGLEFDIVELWKEYKIPDFKKYTRLLIMGGPQSVYDTINKYPSKDFEIASIKTFTKMQKPVLGLCLGSQLIASAFGGRVYQNIVDGKPFKETGFYKIQLTKDGMSDILLKDFSKSFEVFQWHGDIFDLPKNTSLLATGKNVRNQVFKIKNSKTYGFLFHLEFTPKMVEELIKIDNEWLYKNNKANEKAIMKRAYDYEQKIKELSKKLFQNWFRI